MTTTQTTPRRVAVIGQGYVGLPVSMLAVAAGHTVVGYDINPYRIRRLSCGDSYIGDVTDTQLRAALDSGRFLPSRDPDALHGFDVALVTVPTPTQSGCPDLRRIEEASRTLADYVRPGCTVVLESTTWPGTTEEVVVPILETSGLRADHDIHVGYSPERINPGDGLAGVAAVPKIVSGLNAAALHAVAEFWGGLADVVVTAPDIRTAEFTKLLENTFRLVNVSLVNELAQHARALGVNIWEAVRLAATKPYGYLPFRPSPGAGGHCLPVDTAYLAWKIRETGGAPAHLVETATRINDTMPAYVAGRIVTGLAERDIPIDSARILAVGITYKANVADTRESGALRVISQLRRFGADVLAYDPVVTGVPNVVGELTADMVSGAAVVVVLVDHDCIDVAVISEAAYVFDACGRIPVGANVERL